MTFLRENNLVWTTIMYMHYVYEIINLMGTVEYAGISIKPDHRFKEHKSKPGIGRGKFYKRLDVFQHVVCGFKDKKEALKMETKLQKYWGLETDKEKLSKSLRGKIRSSETRKKISEAKKNKPRSPETVKKMSSSLKGRIHSEEHKRKLSEAAKKQHLRRSLES